VQLGDPFFPLGVKTTFKAYSSDVVYEVRKICPRLAVTPIGKATGLETYKVYNTWQPEPSGLNMISTREGIEGFFILKDIPRNALKPMTLKSGSYESLYKSISRIRQRFQYQTSDEKVREVWEAWYDKYMPPENNDAVTYLSKLRANCVPFHAPLKTLLYDDSFYVTNMRWELGSARLKVNPDFEYDYVLQAAMNSVASEHNTQPLQPRFTSEQDTELIGIIDQYEAACKPYYDRMDTTDVRRDHLQDYIRRLVGYDGSQMAIGSAKKFLVKKATAWCGSFVSSLFRSLRSTYCTMVNRTINYIPLTPEASAAVEWTVTDGISPPVEITMGHMISFRNSERLSPQCVRALLVLFRNRDRRICSAHADVNSRENHYRERLPSLFFASDFVTSILQDTIELPHYFPDLAMRSFKKYHRMYCIVDMENGLQNLLIFDIHEKKLYLLDLLVSNSKTLEEEGQDRNETFLRTILGKFRELSDGLGYHEFESWTYEYYPYQYYTPLSRDAIINGEGGSEIYILASIYFLVSETPIYFTPEIIENLVRKNICFWLLSGDLPF